MEATGSSFGKEVAMSRGGKAANKDYTKEHVYPVINWCLSPLEKSRSWCGMDNSESPSPTQE